MAWELSFKHVKLEIDSQVVVLHWLTTEDVLALEIVLLVCDCRNLLRLDHSSSTRITVRPIE